MNRRDPPPPPVQPVEPEPWECCGSGCDPCVYDRYWQDLERYEEALARWQRDYGECHPEDAGPGERIDKAGGSP